VVRDCDPDPAGEGVLPVPWSVIPEKRGRPPHQRLVQVLLGVVVAGFLLRFVNLGANSLWLDEASTLGFARRSLVEIWSTSRPASSTRPSFTGWST